MPDLKVHFSSKIEPQPESEPEPSMCVDAEPYALQVLDDSMQPEFRKGCIILIDPTGRATDGSFVLARCLPEDLDNEPVQQTDGYVFRQLKQYADTWTLEALNHHYPSHSITSDLSEIVGVVVQRAGTRRSYLKRYD